MNVEGADRFMKTVEEPPKDNGKENIKTKNRHQFMLLGFLGLFLYKRLRNTSIFKRKYRIFILYSASFAGYFAFLFVAINAFSLENSDQNLILFIIILILSILYGAEACEEFYEA